MACKLAVMILEHAAQLTSADLQERAHWWVVPSVCQPAQRCVARQVQVGRVSQEHGLNPAVQWLISWQLSPPLQARTCRQAELVPFLTAEQLWVDMAADGIPVTKGTDSCHQDRQQVCQ